jgi:hypothetical protein
MQDETQIQERSTVKKLDLELGPLKLKISKWINFNTLASLATRNASILRPFSLGRNGEIDLQASGDQFQFEFREVTGEDILDYAERAGGAVDPNDIERDESGLITSICASIPSHFDYDFDEMSEVLDSLNAAAAPKKLLGDLAQTSVTVNGVQTQVIGLAEWTISWKRKTADATTTDDAEYATNVGSTKSWTVKSKYMFIDQETSQDTVILAAISTLQNDASLWNFFPTVETGRAAFQGMAIIDGIDIATGMGKCVGTDVSLTGTGPLTILTQVAPVSNPNTVTGVSAQV